MWPSSTLLALSSSLSEIVFGFRLATVLAGRACFEFFAFLCLPFPVGKGGWGPEERRFSLRIGDRVPPILVARSASASDALLALLPTNNFLWNQLIIGLLDFRDNFFVGSGCEAATACWRMGSESVLEAGG